MSAVLTALLVASGVALGAAGDAGPPIIGAVELLRMLAAAGSEPPLILDRRGHRMGPAESGVAATAGPLPEPLGADLPPSAAGDPPW